MSQVVSNNVALFSSIFDKRTKKQSLIGECINTDWHREDFLFLLSDHKCIQWLKNGRVSSMWQVENRLMFTFTSVRDFFQLFLAVDFIRNI